MGVDADVFVTDPSVADLLLVSVLKGIDVAVYDAVMEAAEGNFSTSPFVGTLENGGVGLSEFHDFSSLVAADLSSRLDAIKAGIIDGSIDAESVSSP